MKGLVMFGFEDNDVCDDAFRLSPWNTRTFNRAYRACRPDWCSEDLWECIFSSMYTTINEEYDADCGFLQWMHLVQLRSNNHIIPILWTFISSFSRAPVFIQAQRLPDKYSLGFNRYDPKILIDCRTAPSFSEPCFHTGH